MNTSLVLKYSVLVVFISISIISVGRCQDEDEDEEDAYDEEIGDESSTTRKTTSAKPLASDSNGNGSSTVRTGVEASTRVPVPTPASAPVPTRRATERATTLSEYEDDEATTEEEGYGYVFRPLNHLIDNIVAGNVTGIVDHALSIRTPPEIRAFVNNVMSNVFGAGIGSALRQFMPQLFSTKAPPTALSNERDPIPTQGPPPVQVVIQQPPPSIVQAPIQAVLTARTNGTEEVKTTKNQQPLQVAFMHPGAPASRLRCEVIA